MTEHLDFMVGQESAFLTWSMNTWPSPGEIVVARKLADHRLAYWDYEGPISGDRGIVRRWDRGNCEFLRGTARFDVWLHGAILRGHVQLEVDPPANLADTYRMAWNPA
jgi:hypothetical protein